MAYVTRFRNPRILTALLLVLTIGLAVVAIIVAYNLNKRTTNPTPGQAAQWYPSQCQAKYDELVNHCCANNDCSNPDIDKWCREDYAVNSDGNHKGVIDWGVSQGITCYWANSPTDPPATSTPTPAPNNCLPGQVWDNRDQKCVSACDGSGSTMCHCGGNVCYGISSPVCNPSNPNECIPLDNDPNWPKFQDNNGNWIQSEAKVLISDIGSKLCPKADYRTACRAAQGYMCGVAQAYGNKILGDKDGWRYYDSFSTTAIKISDNLDIAKACNGPDGNTPGVICTQPGEQGNAKYCGNDYWCEGTPPPTTIAPPPTTITDTPTPIPDEKIAVKAICVENNQVLNQSFTVTGPNGYSQTGNTPGEVSGIQNGVAYTVTIDGSNTTSFPNVVLMDGATRTNIYGGSTETFRFHGCTTPVTDTPITRTPTPTPTPSITPDTPTPTPVVCTELIANPNTNLKQGDNINFTLNASETSGIKYKLDYVFNTPTGADQGTKAFQDANTFSVAIPTDKSVTSIKVVGTVSKNGQESTNSNCEFRYSFAPGPDINKEIDTTSSTNIDTSNANYVIVNDTSVVDYDITVSNTGQNVMQNLIVVDWVEAFDPNNNTPVTPAIGDIKNATDLTRTTGTQSNPSPVAPRVPTGNGPYAAGVKKVEWNKIDKLYPSEAYTGSVKVDVLNFNDTPMLRNNVCLYQDTNGNGQYDENVDTELRCDHVDVYTAEPKFTVVKEAFKLDGKTKVDVLQPGDEFIYKLTLKNTSTSAISNIKVSDTFDSKFINNFDITNISDGGKLSGNIITWNITGPIAANATKTLTFNAKVKADIFTGKEDCTLVVRNDVKAITTTPDFTTPISTVYVTVLNKNCSEDFTIVKNVSPQVVAPNGTVTYTAIITNTGDKSAPIVKIVDDYHDLFSYIANTATFVRPNNTTFKKEPTIADGKLTWIFDKNEQVVLNPSQNMTLTYQMKAASGSGSYANTICLITPLGGCDTETVTITTTTPVTGLNSSQMIRIAGFGLLTLGTLYVISIKRRKATLSLSELSKSENSNSFESKIDSIIEKIKR